jgi:hypothetical protein
LAALPFYDELASHEARHDRNADVRCLALVFERDDPFFFIFQVRKRAVLECVPEIHDIGEDPELKRQHDVFATSRNDFMRRFHANDPEALRNPWLKYYFKGRHPDGVVVDNHINKLRVAEPVDKRRADALE